MISVVPQMKKNLISVSKLTYGVARIVEFNSEAFIINDQNHKQ